MSFGLMRFDQILDKEQHYFGFSWINFEQTSINSKYLYILLKILQYIFYKIYFQNVNKYIKAGPESDFIFNLQNKLLDFSVKFMLF